MAQVSHSTSPRASISAKRQMPQGRDSFLGVQVLGVNLEDVLFDAETYPLDRASFEKYMANIAAGALPPFGGALRACAYRLN